MSFHWNLSSEDELEEEEDEVKDNRLAPSPNIGSPRLGDSKVRESGCTPVAAAIAAPVTEMYSDDEGLEWEDADENERVTFKIEARRVGILPYRVEAVVLGTKPAAGQ